MDCFEVDKLAICISEDLHLTSLVPGNDQFAVWAESQRIDLDLIACLKLSDDLKLV